ncbi:sensor domain-containing protein [Planococcus sp. CAU13]|uniref:sensor domain-containing protein n=1 Tax=Planococcus sp. CAU13 TaxID=1541197 RepID=UPI0005300135|nr:PAS domain S-box protein [Planococcus sp. CAU13]
MGNHNKEKLIYDISAYTALFDIIKDPVFLMEKEQDSFRYRYVNPAALAILPFDEVHGRRIDEVLPPEISGPMIQLYENVQSTRNSLEFTEKMETRNGEFFGETMLNPITDENGDCQYILAIVRDVTERERKKRSVLKTQQEMEIERKRLTSLIENNANAVFEFDQHKNFIHVNKMVTEATGYSEEELLGKSILSLVTEDCIEETASKFEKALAGKSIDFVTTIYTKAHKEATFQVNTVPIIIEGEVIGIYAITKEITEQKKVQKALTEAKKELELFWENSTDPIFYIDTNGDILKVNPAFEETFGFTEEEMINLKGTIIPPGMRDDQIRIVEMLLQGETVNSHETIRITKSGKLLNIISSYSPVRNDDKEIIGATIIYKDVTELKKAEKELQKSQEKYKIITESTFDIITMINLDGVVEYVSPAYETISGYSADACIGTSMMENVHPEDAAALMDNVTSLINGGKPSTVEIRFRHQQGHYLWLEVSPTPVLENGEVKQLFTISRDITERRRLQENIARMAFYDHLTGIPNRRTFDDELEKAVRKTQYSGRKVAVFMLDGHKFKQINDQFGHDAGDAVIKEMAVRLQNCMPPEGTAARLGGDEMGAVLPGIDSVDAAENMARQILKSYETPITFNGYEIKISTGIGVALYPDHATNEKQLVKLADMALYEAKKMGQDAYRIYDFEEKQDLSK